MRVVVIGADGQLGLDIVAALRDHELLPLAYPDFDIRDRTQVEQAIAGCQPDWVINSAAMTQVDHCESDDAEAFAVNALGARYAAESAETRDTAARDVVDSHLRVLCLRQLETNRRARVEGVGEDIKCDNRCRRNIIY